MAEEMGELSSESPLVETVEASESIRPRRAGRRRVAVMVVVLAVTLSIVAFNSLRPANHHRVVIRSATAVTPTTDGLSVASPVAGIVTTIVPTSTTDSLVASSPTDVTSTLAPVLWQTDDTLAGQPPPAVDTTTTDPTTTTTLVCHNSTNPACGAFHYEPALTNDPGTATLVASPTDADVGFLAGQDVQLTLFATDPDSAVWGNLDGELQDVTKTGGAFCGWYDFGDGNTGHGDKGPGTCVPNGCPDVLSNRYGAWDVPPTHPTNNVVLITFYMFDRPGTYDVTLTATADPCGPRLSELSATTTVNIPG